MQNLDPRDQFLYLLKVPTMAAGGGWGCGAGRPSDERHLGIGICNFRYFYKIWNICNITYFQSFQDSQFLDLFNICAHYLLGKSDLHIRCTLFQAQPRHVQVQPWWRRGRQPWRLRLNFESYIKLNIEEDFCGPLSVKGHLEKPWPLANCWSSIKEQKGTTNAKKGAD